IHRKYIGEYATSLEMAGASLSIIHLDDELAELIDAPASSPFFRQGAFFGEDSAEPVTGHQATAVAAASVAERTEVRTVAEPGRLREIMLATTERLPAHADELRELDAALGDGDLGITVGSGA